MKRNLLYDWYGLKTIHYTGGDHLRLTRQRIVTSDAVQDNFTKRTPIYKFLRYLVVSSMSIWHMFWQNPFCRLLAVCGS